MVDFQLLETQQKAPRMKSNVVKFDIIKVIRNTLVKPSNGIKSLFRHCHIAQRKIMNPNPTLFRRSFPMAT